MIYAMQSTLLPPVESVLRGRVVAREDRNFECSFADESPAHRHRRRHAGRRPHRQCRPRSHHHRRRFGRAGRGAPDHRHEPRESARPAPCKASSVSAWLAGWPPICVPATSSCPQSVHFGADAWPCHRGWVSHLSRQLPQAHKGALIGVDAPVGTAGGQAQAAQQEWRAGGGHGIAWRGAFRQGAQPAFRGLAGDRRSATSRLAGRRHGRHEGRRLGRHQGGAQGAGPPPVAIARPDSDRF